jgi:uncharacterized protein (TIGR02679 family)
MDRERLHRALGGAEVAWLVERVRRRLGNGRPIAGSVTLQNPTDAQRDAIARLLGRAAPRGASISIRFEEIDALLRNGGICNGLAEGVQELAADALHEDDERAQRQSAWAGLFVDTEQLVESNEAMGRWLAGIRSTGLLRRLTGNDPDAARALIGQVLEAGRRLPAKGIALAELAAALAGDAHALDLGTPLGTLVVRLAACVGAVEGWSGAEARRAAWASAGVLCDELSAPALVLNLRSDGDNSTDRALRLHAAAGEPYRLSVRQLLRTPPHFDARTRAGEVVHFCENASVVAAAANSLGTRSNALVCTEGQPKTAVILLLRLLRAASISVLYHGDFDWPGLRIARFMMQRYTASSWRMSASDYNAAPPGARLRGRPVSTPWDCDLEHALIQRSRAVHEEAVVDGLLKDLDPGGSSSEAVNLTP